MSRRLDQVNELLFREIAEHVREHVEFPRDLLATITRVDTAADLKQAKVYVSVLPFLKHEEAFRFLTRTRGEIQSMLNKKLSMHHIPQIAFVLDATEEKAAEVEAILDDIKIREENGE